MKNQTLKSEAPAGSLPRATRGTPRRHQGAGRALFSIFRAEPGRRGLLALCLYSTLLLAMPFDASAATIYWDKGAGTVTWATLANWSTASNAATPNPGAAPGVSDTAYFNISTLNTPQTNTLAGAISLQGLVFNSTGTTFVDSTANGAITLGTNGLTINSGAGAVTVGTIVNTHRMSFTLGGAQTWQNNSGNTLTLNTRNTINNNGNLLTIDGTNNITTGAGVISGNGGLTKNGSGTLTLAAANTYTGPTLINAGTLASGINSALGAGALTVNGATAIFSLGARTDTTGTLTLDGGGQITGTGTLTVNTTNTFEMKSGSVSAILAGTAALNKTTSGTVILNAAANSTYTGAVTINAGVLNIRQNQSLGTTAGGVSVVSGAALELQGTITVGAEALSLNGAGVSSGGALRNVLNSNTYGGAITLSTSSRINSDSGTLTLNAGITTASGNDLTIGGAGSTTISTVKITGAGNLTKDGGGTLTLSVANDYSGTTTISAGTLALGASGSINNSPTISIAAGATYDVSAIASYTLSASTTLSANGTGTGVNATSF